MLEKPLLQCCSSQRSSSLLWFWMNLMEFDRQLVIAKSHTGREYLEISPDLAINGIFTDETQVGRPFAENLWQFSHSILCTGVKFFIVYYQGVQSELSWNLKPPFLDSLTIICDYFWRFGCILKEFSHHGQSDWISDILMPHILISLI